MLFQFFQFLKDFEEFSHDTIKLCEGSEILSFLQATKLGWHNLKDAGRRPEADGWEMKDLAIHSLHTWQHELCKGFPWLQVSQGWYEDALSGCYIYRRFLSS
jgi:hypothetical protein